MLKSKHFCQLWFLWSSGSDLLVLGSMPVNMSFSPLPHTITSHKHKNSVESCWFLGDRGLHSEKMSHILRNEALNWKIRWKPGHGVWYLQLQTIYDENFSQPVCTKPQFHRHFNPWMCSVISPVHQCRMVNSYCCKTCFGILFLYFLVRIQLQPFT